MNRFADYIEYDHALNKGKALLNDPKRCILGFYIIYSINVGLRISDVLKLKHVEIGDLNVGGEIQLNEQKTGKSRTITINNEVYNAYRKLLGVLKKNVKYDQHGYVFVSQKGTVFSYKSIDRLLKEIFRTKKLQISSHSLRKSFARRFYEQNNRSEHSLMLIGEAFNHSSLSITKRYLGLRKEEVKNIYLSL
ncbi:MAG: tyrosine-type recombinase/integrase [Bacteroidales bacterium]|nr:tyrosine-type recombinase/integrase [Bacteroidales bacterium]